MIQRLVKSRSYIEARRVELDKENIFCYPNNLTKTVNEMPKQNK